MPYPLYQAPPPPRLPYPAAPAAGPSRKRSRGKGIVIAAAVVVVLVGGLVGADLLLRGRADEVVADTVKCVVGDTSTVSIGALPPFAWQYVNGRYTSIRIETSGNRIRNARGMAVDIELRDVRPPAADSAGSVGSADAALTWGVEGIKQTVRDALPWGGSLLTDVTADPDQGTIRLGNVLVGVTVKPKLLDGGGIGLDVVDTDGPGLGAIETLQPALDAYLGKQTLPLGLHADRLSVTDDGVTAHLSSGNASLPAGSTTDCFSVE